ncbi:glycosyltransferase family 2 protein [Pseudomonas sp. BF-R-24]|uniref:glycosyltransferase family 2 protein n=1 Tax=Pseudomonas sp. BF-R-24 TaxID=2832386 RepID=UPI001CBF1B2F|nr:glycosyltransferase family 2 protein [Pseudomonas sp. BF-R-24]
MSITSSRENPFFSIILPTFNVDKYIARCINSCLEQEFSDFEIIVVDDCGNDQSIEIADTFKARDSRVRVLYNQCNKGTFLARKMGVEAARGKYIVFLDPDDCLKSRALSRLHEQVKTHAADIIFFGVEIFPEPPLTSLKRSLPADCFQPSTILKSVFCDTSNASWGTPGKMYSRSLATSAFQKLSFIEERLTFAEDVLYLFTAVAYANSCTRVNEPLYLYFKNLESITETKNYNDISKLYAQIELVKGHLHKVSTDCELIQKNGSALKKSLSKITKELTSNAELMKRFTTDPKNGKKLYFSSVFNSLLARASIKDATRLGLYLCTLGKLKF